MSTLATPLPNPPAQPSKPRNWLQRHWLLAIIGGCFVLMLLFAGFIAALLTVVEGAIKKATPTLKHSPRRVVTRW